MKPLLALCLCVSVAFAPAQDRRRAMMAQLQRSAAGGSTLNDGWISFAYWKMDETSGNRADSGGAGVTLTDNNTVTSLAGLIGNSAQYTSNNLEYLGSTDNAALSTDSNQWVFAGWWKFYTTNVTHMLAGKWSNTNPREWQFQRNGSSQILANVFTNSNGPQIVSTVKPPTNTWVFIALMNDGTNMSLIISSNAPSYEWKQASIAGLFDTSTANTLRIGSQFASGATYFDGETDEMFFGLGRTLTTNEVVELINGGSGKTCCPFAP